MKYVRHDSLGFFLWPTFSDIAHSRVAHFMEVRGGPGIISAGFVVFDGGDLPRCYGRSESLGIDSRPDDSAALAKQFGLAA